MSKKSSLNNRLASSLANVLSSMWCFWVLALICLIAAFIQPPQGAYQWVMFVVSASFQAVALPVLAFVSNIQGERQNKVIDQTNRLVMEELRIIKEQQARLEKLIATGDHLSGKLDEDRDQILDKID